MPYIIASWRRQFRKSVPHSTREWWRTRQPKHKWISWPELLKAWFLSAQVKQISHKYGINLQFENNNMQKVSISGVTKERLQDCLNMWQNLHQSLFKSGHLAQSSRVRSDESLNQHCWSISSILQPSISPNGPNNIMPASNFKSQKLLR